MALRVCPRCEATYLGTVPLCVDCRVPLLDLDETGAPGPNLAPAAPSVGGGPVDLEADDVVGYVLGDWSDEQQAELSAALVAGSIPYTWDGDELVVPEDRADLVEELIDDVDHPDALDADHDTDDDRGAQLLSDLFVASDVLVGDPDNRQAVTELLEASGSIASTSAPFGIERATWATLTERVDLLARLLGEDADEDEVVPAAKAVRDILRPLV